MWSPSDLRKARQDNTMHWPRNLQQRHNLLQCEAYLWKTSVLLSVQAYVQTRKMSVRASVLIKAKNVNIKIAKTMDTIIEQRIWLTEKNFKY